MKPRRAAALGAVLAMLVLSAPQSAIASGPVSVSITAPMPDQSFSGGPIGLSGSASSSSGNMTLAFFTAQDRYSGKYLHSDGTLGSYQKHALTLAAPGTPQTNWSGSIASMPSTEYSFNVTAFDDLGNQTTAFTRISMAPVNPVGPGYLTIQWGRSIWSTSNGQCLPVTNTLTLLDVAKDMQAHGLAGTGSVIIDRTNTTGRFCDPANVYSNWSDLASLRDTYGWTFVSDGMTHNNITQMTPSQQQQESCGSLPPLSTNGHTRASGLFAYGDNHYNTTVQTNVVSTCFSYGRTYRGGRNFRAHLVAPWFQNTNSVLGLNCNQVGAQCFTAFSSSVHYANPQMIADLFNVPGDEWVDVQFYRLVTGQSSAKAAWSWDCTSPDWHLHWTSQTEMYCQNDFDWALTQIPPGVVIADPATVAQAWGRTPG